MLAASLQEPLWHFWAPDCNPPAVPSDVVVLAGPAFVPYAKDGKDVPVLEPCVAIAGKNAFM
ncbi:unnamed protein product, partial [marine sediment metagenome]